MANDNKKKIAVVIPTIRLDSYKIFLDKWSDLFNKHDVEVVTIQDGKEPKLLDYDWNIKDVMGDYSDVIYNLNDGVRNLGFAFVAKSMPEIDVIISMDDDVYPFNNDPIQEHLDALSMTTSLTWMSTASEYTRGFPYNERDIEVVLSHGVWKGVPDFDGVTQLVKGVHELDFPKITIPKGTLFPLCAMNFAFKRKALPYVYQAPMFGNLNRFADIFSGIELKKDFDKLNWAVVSGYSTIFHSRASNVYANIQKEAYGLPLNENYGEDKYFNLFFEKRKRWQDFILRVNKR